MFNYRKKAESRVYQQYKNSPRLLQWILSLPDIIQSNLADQLEKVRNILDIDNAEGEQLNICGRIAGYRRRPVGRFYPDCELSEVDDVLYRKMIKAKICKNNGIATIDDVKAAVDYILEVESTVLDPQDMTMRIIWHEGTVSIAVQKLVEEYDLIPRPQGVGMRQHRVIKRKPFGFGPQFSNFNRAPFWYGDGIPPVYYYGEIILAWDGVKITGLIKANELNTGNVDVTVTIKDEEGNLSFRYMVSDENGEFILTDIIPPAVITAKTMLITHSCVTLELASEELIIN